MSRILEIRKLYKDDFLKKHGVKLGFMGFFLKASVEALKNFPKVNAYIEEQNINEPQGDSSRQPNVHVSRNGSINISYS